MQDTKGKLYLVPSALTVGRSEDIAPGFIRTVTAIQHFFVENLRSARRFLKRVNPDIIIDELTFSVMDKHQAIDLTLLKKWLGNGKDVGLISEAGYPCIADPGNVLVKTAHGMAARVIPLVGPNAMLMALAASGFDGQHFCFSGYIPIHTAERIKTLRELENRAVLDGQTQIFMETPYRNNALLSDILTHLRETTMLCIAADLTAPTEFILSQAIKAWKGRIPDLHKRPAVFLLGKGG